MRRFIILSALLLAWSLAASGWTEAEDLKTISEFTSGDKYAIDAKSVRDLGNGRMEYVVRGEHNGKPSMKSMNRVDCKTGTYWSNLKTWTNQPNGSVKVDTYNPPDTFLLSPGTTLHDTLRDACRAKTGGSW